jgi:peptidoglycan/LPS O-acetylase OafA/YrhL
LFPLLADGMLAVLLFFTLSGYLMFKIFDLRSYQFNVKGLIKFYTGRVKRIVPLYLFVLLIGILFVDTSLLEPKEWTRLWELLTFRQYLSSAKDIIYEKHQWFSIAWSLVVEMQYYLVAPIVAFVLFKIRNIWLNIGFFAAANYFIFIRYWEELIVKNPDFNVLKHITYYIWFFVSGAILVNLIRNSFVKKVLAQLYIFLPFVVFAIFYIPIYKSQHPEIEFIQLHSKHMIFVIHMLVLLTIAIFESHYYYRKPSKLNSENYQLSFRSWKTTLEFFGHLSFGMYLWHLLIIFRLNNIFKVEDRRYFGVSELNYTLIAMLIIFVVSTLIALFTYLNVELFWLKKKSKIITQ